MCSPHLIYTPIQPPPSSTLFPYTTLFRSVGKRGDGRPGRARLHGDPERRAGGDLHPRAVLERRDRRQQRVGPEQRQCVADRRRRDRKSTRLNSSHLVISYAVFCLKKKKNT